MAGRRTDPRVPQLKLEATSLFASGLQAFALDVTGLSRRERNIVRMHVNRWMRINGWHGETTYRDEERETLDVRVVGRRE